MKERLLLAAICLLSALPFLGVTGGGWVLDDVLLIEQNPAVHGFERAADWWTRDMWDLDVEAAQHSERLRFYRPLLLASYAFDWGVGGGSPRNYHITNLLLHALVTGLVFVTFLRWSKKPLWAGLGSLAFAWHPGKTESVAWIAGRPDVLVTLGCLLALLGVSRRLRGRRGGISLEIVGTFVAYASKEQAVVFPVLVLIEWWSHEKKPSLATVWKKRAQAFRFVLPQASIALCYLVLRQVVLPVRTVDVVGLDGTTHGLLVLETLGRYLEALFAPRDLSLFGASIRRSESGLVVHWGYVAAGVAASGAAVGALVYAWSAKKRTLRSAAVAFLAGGLLVVPTTNLVWMAQGTLMSPRFLYLASLVFVWGLCELLRRTLPERVGLASLAIVVSVSGFQTHAHARPYLSSDDFWTSELRENPDVPQVLSWRILRDIEEGEIVRALRRSACAHEAARTQFLHSPAIGKFIYLAIKAESLRLGPESRKERLALARFLADVRQEREGRLEVPFRVSVPADSRAAAFFRSLPGAVRIVEARLRLLLGEEGQALELAHQAIRFCPRCAEVRKEAAVLALALNQREEARKWAQGDTGSSELAERAGALTQAARSKSGRGRAWLLVEREQLLGFSERAFRHLEEFVDELVEAPPAERARAALLAFEANHPAAQKLLHSLPATEQKKVLAQARAAYERRRGAGDEERFLPGGCALRSDFSAR